MKRLVRLLLIALLALTPISARAQSAEEAFAALGSTSFETIRHGVEILALSGHAQAAAILAAVQQNRLFVRNADKVLFIKTDAGGFIDAATGAPAPDVMASGLRAVRMNNAVVSGDNVRLLDEPILGPSANFAHEVAHGWTMDSSGPAANFLQEGWATFCESLVLGDIYGPTAAAAVWERLSTAYFGGQDRAGFLGGFEGRQSLLGDPDNGRIHYYKGSWIFRMLDEVLGDSVFDHGMRTFVRHAGYGPNGYQEFIADMSAAANRDVSPLVMPWLTEKYVPDVDAVVSGSSVIVTQSQPTRPFDLPLDIALTTPHGVVRRAVHLTTKADTIDVSALGGVSDARIDPDHHFLLRRHWGDTAHFALRAPTAKTVELTGNFLSTPVAATRTGDLWTVALPLPEGRYVWLWRVDGSSPSDDLVISDARRQAGDLDARVGVLTVKPVRHLARTVVQ